MRDQTKKNRTPNPKDTVSLTSLHEGETGIIAHAAGGFGLVRRLAELGLTPGTKIKVIRTGAFRGPFQIEVRGCELALGRGVASKVYVTPLKAKPNG